MTCDASKSMLCTAHSSRRNRHSRLSLKDRYVDAVINASRSLGPVENNNRNRGRRWQTINGYIPQVTPLMFESEEGQRMASACIEYGGWDHKNRTLMPIKLGTTGETS
jgi:hypothetical protein